MYGGHGKDDGGVVGLIAGGDETIDYSYAYESTRAEESLMCAMTDMNGEDVPVCMVSSLDHATGDLQWTMGDTAHVQRKTVGMSQMTSMLRDTCRNDVYEKAIAAGIAHFKDVAGRPPRVLDIGCGTGLLSLMCARHGAESVLGCEMYESMANIARDVVAANGFDTNVHILEGKSTQIEPETISELLPDMIVSELLDSALLGESVMYSHADAISRLLQSSPRVEDGESAIAVQDRVIPHSGEVFGCLVEGLAINSMVCVQGGAVNGISVWRDDDHASSCRGGWPLIPVHWNMLAQNGARTLSEAAEIQSVDFFNGFSSVGDNHSRQAGEGSDEEVDDIDMSSPLVAESKDSRLTQISVVRDGIVHGVLVWWKVYLLSPAVDPERSLFYTTDPSCTGSGEETKWQDHWTQCVFPLAEPIQVQAGDVLSVRTSRDHIKMWIEVSQVSPVDGDQQASASPSASSFKRSRVEGEEQIVHDSFRFTQVGEPEACRCGWHMLCGAERLQMLNDSIRRETWERALRVVILETLKLISESSVQTSSSEESISAWGKRMCVILDVGDGSLLALAAAQELKSLIDSSDETALAPSSSSTAQLASNLWVVSREKKLFSRLFHSQLCGANDLDGRLLVWDGEDWTEIVDLSNETLDASTADRADEEEEEESDEALSVEGEGQGLIASTKSSPQQQHVEVAALISECFYYQLCGLPTWQAVSFLYQRWANSSRTMERALVMPQRAFIMAAAVELMDLHVSHGLCKSVSGFQHSPYDDFIEDWHTNMFPYKLGNYRHRLLTEPVCISDIDYWTTSVGDGWTESGDGEESVRRSTVQRRIPISVTSSGSAAAAAVCHGVVVWVDYQLIHHSMLPEGSDLEEFCVRGWREVGGFPGYQATNIKFFPHAVPVSNSSTLTCTTSFEIGNSDFSHNFEIN